MVIFHRKVAEEAEELHLKKLFSAIMPGSEKIRRIVEVLRADVIRGLGIQLLEQVYDILEEEDELEREVSIQTVAVPAAYAMGFFYWPLGL